MLGSKKTPAKKAAVAKKIVKKTGSCGTAKRK